MGNKLTGKGRHQPSSPGPPAVAPTSSQPATSSAVTRHPARAPAAEQPVRPTQQRRSTVNYGKAMNDVAEFQGYLGVLKAELSISSTADDGLDLETTLAMLSVRQEDLKAIRHQAQHGTAASRGSDHAAVLVQMIDEADEDCQQVMDRLRQLQLQQQQQMERDGQRAVEPSLVVVDVDPAPQSFSTETPPRLMSQTVFTQPPTVSLPGAAAEGGSGQRHFSIDHQPPNAAINDEETTLSAAAAAGASEDRRTELITDEDENHNRPYKNTNTSPDGGDGEGVRSRTLDDWRLSQTESISPGSEPQFQTTWKLDREVPDIVETIFCLYSKAKDRDINRKLAVVFDREMGVDGGALTREFFHLGFEAVISRNYKDCSMFEGERGHLLPGENVEHLVPGFKCIGIMIAHAARNECRGFPGLSPALQHYIIHANGPAFLEEMVPPVSIDDISDERLREILFKLRLAENLTDSERDLLDTWLEKSRCRVALSPKTVDLIIQTLLIFYIYNCRIRQIEAIALGLETMGLRQFLRDNPTPENFAFVFPSPTATVVTADMFMERVITRGDQYSEQTFSFLRQFLHDLQHGSIASCANKLSDLIQFLSGSPYIPTRVVISFNSAIVYPVAHCCFNELELPTTHQTYDTFRDAVVFSLQHGTGFSME